MVRLDTSQPGMGLMSTSGITHRDTELILKLYIWGEKFVMMFQTYLRRDWDNEIETGVELRAENQFLATCQAASVSVKCLGMSLLRLSEISPQLSDILCPSSRCDDARPVIRICILAIFSSLLLNVSYLNLMFLQYSTCPGYWPGYEWPGLCQGPSCQ